MQCMLSEWFVYIEQIIVSILLYIKWALFSISWTIFRLGLCSSFCENGLKYFFICFSLFFKAGLLHVKLPLLYNFCYIYSFLCQSQFCSHFWELMCSVPDFLYFGRLYFVDESLSKKSLKYCVSWLFLFTVSGRILYEFHCHVYRILCIFTNVSSHCYKSYVAKIVYYTIISISSMICMPFMILL